ncbi:FG-GAP-like repeat-containing protein [Parasegetibacter sp. NRK P23]|uniref:FG-GAP-like repeat-containing protein n=1 Tax=Parasegetibacter sp. NRK P23 TaxID=2942999 RepID=UPI0020444F65|nr:FG-GAP-like repeat-containing protein [Parasegetibacter sp. NRK P23]MCM5529684.1 FG-GAP-like repeat-containing protein [Parasegetibacter sp. NRK P23]
MWIGLSVPSLRFFCLFIFTSLSSLNSFSQPSIFSFYPASGNAGALITLYGKNFSTVPEQNIVKFGGTNAVVHAATGSSLKVSVPSGAAYQQISVTTNGLTCYSNIPFTYTFQGGDEIGKSSFQVRKEAVIAAPPHGLASGDLDGDGYPDVVAVKGEYPYGVSVLRNLSANEPFAYSEVVNLPTELAPLFLSLGDVDGDGRLDIAATNSESHTVSVFINTSLAGQISFSEAGSFTTGSGPGYLSVGELNGDGKPDIVVANFVAHTISILYNLSEAGIVSFGNRVDYPTMPYPDRIILADLDGDYDEEIIVGNSNGVEVFRNGYAEGTGSFEKSLTLPGRGVLAAELNGDNSLDLISINADGKLNVFMNIGVPQVLYFQEYSYDLPPSPAMLIANDFNGDGKVDIAVNNQTDSIAFLKNYSGFGEVMFLKGENVIGSFNLDRSFLSTDVNKDGRPDIIGGNQNVSKIVVLKNTIDAPIIRSYSPSSGLAGTEVSLKGRNFTGVRSITFGGVAASEFTIDSDSAATAIVGVGGTGYVMVESDAGVDSLQGFTFLYPPAIEKFSPQTARRGTVVTIEGTSFHEVADVFFGGVSAKSFEVLSSTRIKATVDDGASGDVSLYTPFGNAKKAGFYFLSPADVPLISSVTPLSAGYGSVVVINGENFNAVAAENIVYFGTVKADVIAADTNALSVIVPLGAANDFVTVTTNRQTAYSPLEFCATFPGLGVLDVNLIEPYKAFLGGINSGNNCNADIDGDGKPEILSLGANGVLSVLRNTSTPGVVSFAAKVDFSTGASPFDIATADIDGDGKLDVIVANDGGSSVSVLRNSSTVGIISLAPKIDLPAISHCRSVATADFDRDGRPDIVVCNAAVGKLSVFRNISEEGEILFGERVDYEAGKDPYSVAVGDLDGDGKHDIAAVNYSNGTISVFRNTSEEQNISFVKESDIKINASPNSLQIKDMDADGKPDLLASHSLFDPGLISLCKNVSTPRNIVFNETVNLVAGVVPSDLAIEDMDGDGKPDILASLAGGQNGVAILKNKSTLSGFSFESAQDVTLGSEIFSTALSTGDMDGDGKSDIIITDYDYRSNYAFVAILRNAMSEPRIIANGSNPVSGFIAKSMKYDSEVKVYNGSPFVQRHYDIEPENNAASATGRVTLYFTQRDFDNFNSHPLRVGFLPRNPGDISAESNLRIFQFHGTSLTGEPGTYSGHVVEIDPPINQIIWNETSGLWEISFDVNGFSGFFVGTKDASILSLSLRVFSAQVKSKLVEFSWETVNEANVLFFELQKSADGYNFGKVAHVEAMNIQHAFYQYLDKPGDLKLYFYRLKIVEADGAYSFSKTLAVRATELNDIKVFPNPASSFFYVEHAPVEPGTFILIMDGTGRVVQRVQTSNNSIRTKVDIQSFPRGAYQVVLKNRSELIPLGRILKQ